MIFHKNYLVNALQLIIIVILIGINSYLWRKIVRLNRDNVKLKTDLVSSNQILELIKQQLESEKKHKKPEKRTHENKLFEMNNNIIIHDDRFYPDLLPLTEDFAVSQRFSESHPAIDLAAPFGAEVFSSGSGIVIACSIDKYLGNVLIINHLNNYKTLYAHLSSYTVKVNDFVDKGDQIGSVGNSGLSSNPHLHFELNFQNKPIDPEKIMSIPTVKVNP